jgi:hypothetical protein
MTRVYVARALRELAGLPLDGLWPSGNVGARRRGELRTMGRSRWSERGGSCRPRGAARPGTCRGRTGTGPSGSSCMGRRLHVGDAHASRPPTVRQR